MYIDGFEACIVCTVCRACLGFPSRPGKHVPAATGADSTSGMHLPSLTTSLSFLSDQRCRMQIDESLRSVDDSVTRQIADAVQSVQHKLHRSIFHREDIVSVFQVLTKEVSPEFIDELVKDLEDTERPGEVSAERLQSSLIELAIEDEKKSDLMQAMKAIAGDQVCVCVTSFAGISDPNRSQPYITEEQLVAALGPDLGHSIAEDMNSFPCVDGVECHLDYAAFLLNYFLNASVTSPSGGGRGSSRRSSRVAKSLYRSRSSMSIPAASSPVSSSSASASSPHAR